MAPRMPMWAMVHCNFVISCGAKDKFEILVKEFKTNLEFKLLNVP